MASQAPHKLVLVVDKASAYADNELVDKASAGTAPRVPHKSAPVADKASAESHVLDTLF